MQSIRRKEAQRQNIHKGDNNTAPPQTSTPFSMDNVCCCTQFSYTENQCLWFTTAPGLVHQALNLSDAGQLSELYHFQRLAQTCLELRVTPSHVLQVTLSRLTMSQLDEVMRPVKHFQPPSQSILIPPLY